jgi:hypothetical protein
MGSNYGFGPVFLGDCNDCGIEHYGRWGEEHSEDPLCPRCVKRHDKADAKAEKARTKAAEKAARAAAKVATKTAKAAATAAAKKAATAATAKAAGSKRARGET